MKLFLYLTLMWFTTSFSKIFAQDYTHASDGKFIVNVAGQLEMTPSDCPTEINYISNNISNIRISSHGGTVYFMWNVCGDTTSSSFLLLKSYDSEKFEAIGFKENVQVDNDSPLLYSILYRENCQRTIYYKLFKILEDGKIVHIATILLPAPIFTDNIQKQKSADSKKSVKPKKLLNINIEYGEGRVK